MRKAILLGAALAVGPVSAAAVEPPSEAPYRFILAKKLAEERRFQEAVAEYRALLDLLPQEPYLRIEYSELLSRLGRSEGAVRQAEAARGLAPANADALRAFARAHFSRADEDPDSLEAAREGFEELRRRGSADASSMVSLGQIYLSQGRPEEAVAVFLEVARLRPGNRMVDSLLLDALLKAGREGEAEGILRELLAADPSDLQSRLTLSELLSRRGEHGAAAGILAAAPAGDLAEVELRRQMALELYRAGELDEALRTVESVLAEEPDFLGGRYLRALILVEVGKPEAAEEELRHLLEKAPANPEIAFALARLLERQGRWREAMVPLQETGERLRTLGRQEEARQAALALALLLARAGEWERVVEVTASLDPPDGDPAGEELLSVRVEALLETGRGEEALEAVVAARSRRPGEPGLLAKQAQVLLAVGKEEEGRRLLGELAAGDGVERRLMVAEVYRRLERYGDAVPHLQRALEQRPDSVEVLFWLGAAYERSQRRDDAEGAFRRLLELDPDFAPALNYLGYMWAEQGENLEEALTLTQRAVALDPENGAYVDSLGWAHFQLGQFEEARQHLERAARLVPDDATVQEHLGDLYVALSRAEEARRAYRRALNLDGDNVDELRRKLRDLGGSP